MGTLANSIMRGTRGSQPAATAVSIGSLYCVTDESNLLERSNGTIWQSYSASGAGSGTVTNTGTLTDHALIVGNGGVDVSALASLGTTVTVLHGNASGDPTFGQVSLTADVTGTLPAANGGTKLVQTVNTETGASATGSTTIPIDNTIPQISEGTEYMTRAITPTSSSNKLKITVVFIGSPGASNKWMVVSLFQDAANDALATWPDFQATGTATLTITGVHYMTAGTTSATTFRVRAGTQDGTTITFNGGNSVGQLFGGTCGSSITIEEIVP